MSTGDNLPFQHPPLLVKVFTAYCEMQASHNLRRESDNWAEKATIWYWVGRKSLATAKGLFWSRLAALGGPTTLRAWHKQPNQNLIKQARFPNIYFCTGAIENLFA